MNRSLLQIALLFCCHLFCIALLGQEANPRVDSLETVLAEAQTDQEKIELYKALAKEFRFSNREKEKNYLQKLVLTAKKTNDFENLNFGYLRFGNHFYHMNNPDSSLFYVEKVLAEEATLIKLNLNEFIGQAYSLKGQLEMRGNDPRKGLEYFDKAASIYKDENFLLRLNGSRGVAYGILSQFNEALKYFTSALENAEKVNDKNSQGRMKANIGKVYDSLQDYESAIRLKKEALEIFKELEDERAQLIVTLNIGSSYYQMDSPEQIPTLTEAFEKGLEMKDPTTASAALWQLVDRLSKKDFKKAEKLIDRYLEFEKAYPPGGYSQSSLYALLAKIYNRGKKYAKGEKFAQFAIDQMKTAGHEASLDYANALEALSESQFHKGKYLSARNLLLEADSIRMNNFRNSNKEELAKAAAQFKVREKELALEKAEREKQYQIEKAAADRRAYLLLLGAAGLILLIGFFSYRNIQATNNAMIEQKNLVEQALTEKEVLLKEIHHRVKNNLQIISGLLSKQARKTPDVQVKKMIKEGRDRVYSMALVHQNLYESDNLAAIDIKNYLEELTRNIASTQQSKNIEVELRVDDSQLDIDTAIPVGLILNELITNAFKYAFTESMDGKISISFYKKAEAYFLSVKDNGIGLPDSFDISKTKSLGLNLVKGLVEQLEGSLSFEGTGVGAFFEINFEG